MVHNPSIGENKKIGSNTILFLVFTTTEKGRKLESKWVRQLFLGLSLGTQQSAFCQFFSLSVATVLKVFAKVISLKWQIVIQGCYPVWHFFFNLSDTCSSEVWKEYLGISRRDVFVRTTILIIRVSTVSADHVHISRDDQTEDLFACPQRLGF